MTDRREKDGRRARSAKPRAPYQTRVDARGRTTFHKQITNPATKKREWVQGDSIEELLGRVDAIRRARRNVKHGLVDFGGLVKEVDAALRKGFEFRDAWAKWSKSRHLSPAWQSKLTGYWLNHIAPKDGGLGDLHVHELSGEKLQDWVAWMTAKGTVGGKTIANVWHEIRACINAAIEGQRINAVPWGAWKLRLDLESRARKPRAGIQDGDELARCMAVAESMAAHDFRRCGVLPDLHIRFALMNLLALRRGEAIALSWDHIRTEPSGRVVARIEHQAREGWRQVAGTGFARPISQTKTANVRPIICGKRMIGMLSEQRRLLEAAGLYRPDGPVFPDSNGNFRARNVIEPERYRRIVKAAGIHRASVEHWTQHSARHGGVRLQIAAGATMTETMALAGHTNPNTTRGYFGDMHRDAAVARADGVLLGEEMVERFPVNPLALEAAAPLLSEVAIEARLGDAVAVQHARARGYHEKSLGRSVAPLSLAVDLSSVRVPQSVRDAANASYRKAYNAARRQGLTPKECADAGRRSKRGIFGAYGTVKARERKRVEGAASTELAEVRQLTGKKKT